jgi:hypothetical protein
MTIMTLVEAANTGQLAAQIFGEIESIDRHWLARREERFLGIYESLDEDEAELARVAILGRIDGHWFAGTCLVDGEGAVQDLLGSRVFADHREAGRAYRRLR